MGLENLVHNGKNLFRKIILASAVTAASLITVACPPPPPPPPNPTIHVFSEEEAGQISEVTDDELYFSQPVDYSEGDIIISGITDTTPDGLFREVTEVSSDGTILYTETASMEDAIEDADFEFSTTLSPDGARFVGQRGISFSQKSVTDPAFHLTFDRVVLYDFDDNPNSGNEVVADGEIDFNIDVNIGAKLDDFSLKKFNFEVAIAETGLLEVGISESPGFIDEKVTLGEFYIPSFLIGTIPTPIPIPLIVKPRLEIIGKIKGGAARVSVNVEQNATISAGLVYENYQWSPILDFDNSFSFDSPLLHETLSIKASAGPKLAFKLYDVAGPYGELNGFLRLDYNILTGNWGLYGGLEAILGVEAKILKKALLDYSKTILDEEWWLAGNNGGGGEPEPPSTEKILFVSSRDGNGEIYRMNSDGTNHENLTNRLGHDYEPSWSPDKIKIVFVSERDGNAEIYTMNANGTSQTRLTNNTAIDRYPDWSPDGTKIVFYSTRSGTYGSEGIWTVSSSGGTPTQLNLPTGVHIQPRWSPNGNEIVFASFLAGGDLEIFKAYVSNPSNPTQLTNNSIIDIEPVWSPNGSKIAYASGASYETDFDVWVMNSDSSGKDNLSDYGFGYNANQPSWSPDGTKIAYTLRSNYGSEIYSMSSTTGLSKTRLNNYSGYYSATDLHPAWNK